MRGSRSKQWLPPRLAPAMLLLSCRQQMMKRTCRLCLRKLAPWSRLLMMILVRCHASVVLPSIVALCRMLLFCARSSCLNFHPLPKFALLAALAECGRAPLTWLLRLRAACSAALCGIGNIQWRRRVHTSVAWCPWTR